MTSASLAPERISIDDHTVQLARETPALETSTLVLRAADGAEVALPDDLQRVLLGALGSIAQGGSVSIGRMPEELTSTVAADVLGISRPTLMKLAKDGEIDSYKVGTHTRFARDEVLRVRARRAEQRSIAIEALRAFDEDHADAFDE